MVYGLLLEKCIPDQLSWSERHSYKVEVASSSLALGTNRTCPSWSKGSDLRPDVFRYAWVQIPHHALYPRSSVGQSAVLIKRRSTVQARPWIPCLLAQFGQRIRLLIWGLGVRVPQRLKSFKQYRLNLIAIWRSGSVSGS